MTLQVYQDLSTRRLLVSEWVDGIKLTQAPPEEVRDACVYHRVPSMHGAGRSRTCTCWLIDESIDGSPQRPHTTDKQNPKTNQNHRSAASPGLPRRPSCGSCSSTASCTRTPTRCVLHACSGLCEWCCVDACGGLSGHKPNDPMHFGLTAIKPHIHTQTRTLIGQHPPPLPRGSRDQGGHCFAGLWATQHRFGGGSGSHDQR